MPASFSDRELLALSAIGRRCPAKSQRPRQAEVMAEFSAEEGLPSCMLVRRRRWSRGEAARQRMIGRWLSGGAA